MRRRSRAGGEPVKTRRRKTVTLKRRNAANAVRRRRSAAAGHETEVARLTRELYEAQEQQRATSEILGVVARSRTDVQSVLGPDRARWRSSSGKGLGLNPKG
jgi:hypothetical protein